MLIKLGYFRPNLSHWDWDLNWVKGILMEYFWDIILYIFMYNFNDDCYSSLMAFKFCKNRYDKNISIWPNFEIELVFCVTNLLQFATWNKNVPHQTITKIYIYTGQIQKNVSTPKTIFKFSSKKSCLLILKWILCEVKKSSNFEQKMVWKTIKNGYKKGDREKMSLKYMTIFMSNFILLKLCWKGQTVLFLVLDQYLITLTLLKASGFFAKSHLSYQFSIYSNDFDKK